MVGAYFCILEKLRRFKASKISMSHITLNFEIRQILYITFSTEINTPNKKVLIQILSKLGNKGTTRILRFQYYIGPLVLKLYKFYT